MSNRTTSKLTDYLFVLLLVIYIFLFEWPIFEIPLIEPIINTLKIGIPIMLFLIVFYSNTIFYRFLAFENYLIILILFYAWAFVPSILSDHASECVGQWAKLLIRCSVLFSAGIYFMARPHAQLVTIKVFATLGLFIVIQYFLLIYLLNENPFVKPQALSGNGTPLYGPLGILGGGIPLHFINLYRLVSFWREPSNASGFLFPIFFLSQAIYIYSQQKIWRFIGYICLVGAFLCLSNAGYLGFTGALLFGILRVVRLPKIKLMHLVGLVAAIFFILFAIWGRFYVANHNIDSIFLRSITGATFNNESELSYNEISGGRVELFQSNLQTLLAHPIGIGVRIPGTDSSGRGFTVSAGAIGYWLTFIGLPGVLFLLLLQLQVLYTNLKYSISDYQLRITQAWIAAILQQSVYGNWMSPFIFILTVFVFASIFQQIIFKRPVNNNFYVASALD